MSTESYVYKKTVDWSTLAEGFTIPVREQVIFCRNMNAFLQKGEQKEINVFFNGKTYKAMLRNEGFSEKFNHSDIVQIRYPKNGEFARVLQASFVHTYDFIKAQRESRKAGDRKLIRMPEEDKEYLAIYASEYADTYIFEAITREDVAETREVASTLPELQAEELFDLDEKDPTARIVTTTKVAKVRKLNRLIGNNLKLLYGYRCQICGKQIGEEYGAHIAEAHHIDYFTRSGNNDASNQTIVCPNHHRIIHEADPRFDRKRLLYIFPNGKEEKLTLNKHLF